MDQFGVHMDFLQLKQVSAINLIPKSISQLISLIFELTGLGLNSRERQGLTRNCFQDTDYPRGGPRVVFCFS